MNTIIKIGQDKLEVCPHEVYEWTLDTKSVAVGYEVTPENIRQHKFQNPDELLEGKHWFTVRNPNGGSGFTFWTKRGVIRLGFLIKSERAKKFRDLAEDLILEKSEEAPVTTDPVLATLQVIAKIREEQLSLSVEVAKLKEQASGRLINSREANEIHKTVGVLAQACGDYGMAWRIFKGAFGIPAYRDLEAERMPAAREFLKKQIESFQADRGLGFKSANARSV